MYLRQLLLEFLLDLDWCGEDDNLTLKKFLDILRDFLETTKIDGVSFWKYVEDFSSELFLEKISVENLDKEKKFKKGSYKILIIQEKQNG
jgi:hypothetical protein